MGMTYQTNEKHLTIFPDYFVGVVELAIYCYNNFVGVVELAIYCYNNCFLLLVFTNNLLKCL